MGEVIQPQPPLRHPFSGALFVRHSKSVRRPCPLFTSAHLRESDRFGSKAYRFGFGSFSRLFRDERGIAAVEFAIILPLMMVTYLGLTSLSRGLRASYKLEQAARTIADVTAQKLGGGKAEGQAAFGNGDRTAAFAIATAILDNAPGTIKLAVSEVKVDMDPAVKDRLVPRGRIQWSMTNCAPGGANSPCTGGETMLRPCGVNLIASNDYAPGNIRSEFITGSATRWIIVVDIKYAYRPGLNFELFKWNRAPTWEIQQTAYSPIRNTYNPAHLQWLATSNQTEADTGPNCNYPNP